MGEIGISPESVRSPKMKICFHFLLTADSRTFGSILSFQQLLKRTPEGVLFSSSGDERIRTSEGIAPLTP